MSLFRRVLIVSMVLLFAGDRANDASAQSFEILAPRLGAPPATGAQPSAGVMLGSDGNFYGTTYEGGANGYGMIFRMTPEGVVTALHSFDNTNGSHPYAELVEGADGNLYGTTNDQAAGSNRVGSVFMITKQGTGFAVLHSLLPYI